MTKEKRRPRRSDRKTIALPKVRDVVMGKVIAARRLESARNAVPVTVEIGMPRRARGHDDYLCPYRVKGIGDEVVRASYGVDAVQALELVMYAIGSTLAKHAHLRWFGDKNLGLPHPEDLFALQRARARRRGSPRRTK
jgi:hypothetical protein